MEVALGGGCAITWVTVMAGSGCANKGFCTITAVVSEVLVETDGISIAVDGLFSSGLASAWGAGMFVCGGCAVLCSAEVPDCS